MIINISINLYTYSAWMHTKKSHFQRKDYFQRNCLKFYPPLENLSPQTYYLFSIFCYFTFMNKTYFFSIQNTVLHKDCGLIRCVLSVLFSKWLISYNKVQFLFCSWMSCFLISWKPCCSLVGTLQTVLDLMSISLYLPPLTLFLPLSK